MSSKVINAIIFILSIICLIISSRLFWNMSIFIDGYNLSPSVVYGGYFWGYMNWLELFFIALISILSGINLFIKK